MALLMIEGFDQHINFFGGASDIQGLFYSDYWDNTATGASYAVTSTARTGGTAGQPDNGGVFHSHPLSPGSTTGIIGTAVRFPTTVPTDVQLFGLYEGTTSHINIYINSDSSFSVRRGTVTLDTSATGLVLANTWYYMELKATIHDSTGIYEFKIDETSILSGSGADTRNGGTGQWDRVRIKNAEGSNKFFIVDDLYVCDTTGSINNDFLGNSYVETRFPRTDASAGNATNRDFTLSTGSDHGALVDETVSNGDSDYVFSSTVGHRESFIYPNLAISGTIRGVATVPHHKKSDVGARTVKTMARSGGTNYDHGTAITPTGDYRFNHQIWETDPDTGVGWGAAGVNAAEFGFKIES